LVGKTEHQPTHEQLECVDHIVNDMGLTSTSTQHPFHHVTMLNPMIAGFNAFQIARALHSDETMMHRDMPISKISQFPGTELRIARAKDLFNLHDNQMQREIFRPAMEEPSHKRARISPDGSSRGNAHAVCKHQLSIFQPMQEYDALLANVNEKSECLAALQALRQVIFKLVDISITGNKYDLATQCATKLRTECITCRSVFDVSTAHIFNEFLLHAFQHYNSPPHTFWTELEDQGQKLIGTDEDPESAVSVAQAAKTSRALHEMVMTISSGRDPDRQLPHPKAVDDEEFEDMD